MLLVGLIVIGLAPAAFAQTASSTHYSVSETDFGAGSTSQTCSGGQYCASTSLGGGLNSGNASSANYVASFGPITPNEPSLDVIVNDGQKDLGVLTTEQTAYKSTEVKVRNYLSSGYVIQVTGTPPKYASHTLAALSTPSSPDPGHEQFGINLVDNSSPNIGADPVQVPSGEFSFGIVEDNYKTPNKFMFNSGDTVARSPSQSGETDYTISMILNIANNTPAGRYIGSYAAVVIPVY
jgi:hypothetical protein